MSFFAKEEHKITVTDSDGTEGHVWIRELNTKKEALKLQKTVKFKMKGRKQDTKFDIAGDRMYDLYRCIVRWDFTDDEGNPVPKTNENIDNLSLYVSKQIRKALEKLHELPEDIEDEDEDDDEDDDEDSDFEDEDDEDLALANGSAKEQHPTTAG